jgi:DNA-binding transcriptional ArsR family regulator
MSEVPFGSLERLFHEPSRLQILSLLAAAPSGLTFPELKTKSAMTDGNLSRHLKTLQELGAVRIEKAFVNAKPRTTVFLSEEGRMKFLSYLESLEKVLKAARQAAATDLGPLAADPETA